MRNPVGWLILLASIGLGQNWEMRSIIPETGGAAFDADVVTDSLCLPHVAFNHIDRGLAYASWKGDSWSIEYPTVAYGFGLDLCLDRNDNPHIAYRSSALCYTHRDGDTWHIETAAAHGNAPSLALARDGTPHIGFVEWNLDTVKYAYKAADTWNVLTVPAYQADPLRQLIGVSIALDTSDRPGIAVDWYRYHGGYDSLWLSFFEYDGQSWHRSDVDSATGNPPFDFWIPQVRSDPATDLFHVVYRARAYATGKDGNWQVEEAPVPSCGQYACDFVLHRGRPHIVSSGGMFPVQYTWRSAAGWETEWVGPSGTFDGSPSIAVDRKGWPHLTFVSVDDESLYYARRLFAGTEEPAPAIVQQKSQLLVRPNPAFGDFTVQYGVPVKGRVRLTLCDVQGRVERVIRDGELNPGYYRETFRKDARSVPAGVHFLVLAQNGKRVTRKLALMQ